LFNHEHRIQIELEDNDMKAFKKVLLPILTGALALALVIPVAAQDPTATTDAGTTGSTDTTGAMAQGTGTLNCDSSTILLAGLAQRYFGYAPTDVTLGNYVYGQYSPLFDMSTMMNSGSTSGSTGMTGEATADASGSTTGSTDTTGSTSGSPTLVPSTTMLNSAVIAGEDPACTTLRTSLESFFSTQLQSGTSSWDSRFGSGMSGTGASG
jgi:hypothetical protein